MDSMTIATILLVVLFVGVTALVMLVRQLVGGAEVLDVGPETRARLVGASVVQDPSPPVVVLLELRPGRIEQPRLSSRLTWWSVQANPGGEQ